MTPNPNPSPELLPCPFCGGEAACDDVGSLRALYTVGCNNNACEADCHFTGTESYAPLIAVWNTRAALSPQTLPAPGEVEVREQIGRELIGWDNQMSPEAIAHPNNAAFFAHWLDVTNPNDGEQAKHYHAGIDMILRLTPTLATVAAANDEGVAKAIEALEDIAEHAETRIQDGTEMGATVWRLALEDIVRDARAAIRLLSQGGGK